MTAVEGAQHPARGGFDALTLEEVMKWLRVPGLSIAVIDEFQVHWAKGYGVADVESGATVDSETLFQAGSISKPVTAMALLKAAQDGRLSLDESINRVLRSWKLPESGFTRHRSVTARMLASHTAGLGDGFGFPGYAPGEPLPSTVQILNGQAPANTGPVLMEREPLQARKYSGGGTTILELALTDLVGRPFPEILHDWVLEPLGMTQSAFEQPLSPVRDSKAARGHDERGQSLGAKWRVYPESAAAGLWSTPTDLAKFAIEVQRSVHGDSNRVLSRATVQEMLNPVGVGDNAVGFAIERQGEGWYLKHAGSTGGFNSFLLAHKVKGYGIAVMVNNASATPSRMVTEIKERVQRVYGWDSLDKGVLR